MVVEITGFIKPRKQQIDYCVFGIVLGLVGGIPMVVDKNRGGIKREKEMLKFPGGKPLFGRDKGDPKNTLMRELFDELGIIVKEPEGEPLFIKEKINRTGQKYNFIVYVVRWYNGKIKLDEEEIERVELFNIDQIIQKISSGDILNDHAEAARKYEETVLKLL